MIDRSREKSSAGLSLISCRWRERGRDISERREAIVSGDTVPKLIVRPDDLLDKQHYNKNGPEHLATNGQTELTSRGRLFKVSLSLSCTVKICPLTIVIIPVKQFFPIIGQD